MTAQERPSGIGVDILIVEDRAIQATLLKRTLAQHGYAVTVAKNGAEWLAMIRARKPTLVISDIEMPGMDGYAMCREIKRDEALRDIPVILLTSLSDPEDIVRGLHAGADNYLTKPYDEPYLLSRIDYVLSNRQPRTGDREQGGIALHFAGKRHLIASDRQQILDLLISTFENAVRQNRELLSAQLELRTLNEQLKQARDDALAASQAKSEFLARMSHELRTPLNAIIGYSEMLQEEAQDLGDEALIPDLQKIHTAGKHLLALINDILDLSKIEAGKMDLFLETFDIAPMLQDVATTVRPLVAKNTNTLEVRCPDGVGAMRADLTKVRQSLFNLLSNACKFTQRGTISLESAREAVDGMEWLTFRVRDTGIGMTPAQMGKLFQVFSQAEASTASQYGGTGLGLAITKRFCQLMGGDITVESAPGKGTTFTITLPVDSSSPEAQPAPQLEAKPHALPTGGPCVLVIDDDPTVHDLLGRFLSREGFQVVSAVGGEEGLRLARAVRPAAITLDVMMPGMDGWAVLTALKADPGLADIPVVVLTIVDDKNLGYALGATDYLIKPVERDRLVAILDKYRPADSSRQVLLVEDDADIRALLGHMLEQEGWAVREAENGRVGLARVAERRPDLILLDLLMPEMDGFEFVEALRQEQAGRTLPIVVVTAKDLTEEDRLRLNGYVEKILQKGAYSREALLREVGDLVAACVRRKAPGNASSCGGKEPRDAEDPAGRR